MATLIWHRFDNDFFLNVLTFFYFETWDKQAYLV